MADDRLCILSVHAHPDDEASKGAGTIARYHAEGVRTVLVTCTGGEAGDILNPAMDRPEVRADLPAVRLRELARAAEIIGYDEVVLLGWRDSGMPDTPENAHPDAFANADLDEAVGRLVAVIRRERPQVVVTYPDEQNFYPHPDHLRVHEISLLAFERAGDPGAHPEAGEPWQPLKLYYSVWSRKRIELTHARLLELGLESPYDAKWFERPSQDERITTTIDITGHAEARIEALLAHETQIDPKSPHWFALPRDEQLTVYPFEDYHLARDLTRKAERPRRCRVSGPVGYVRQNSRRGPRTGARASASPRRAGTTRAASAGPPAGRLARLGARPDGGLTCRPSRSSPPRARPASPPRRPRWRRWPPPPTGRSSSSSTRPAARSRP
jgi:mycothiol S-conjugate amidase